MRRKWNKGFTLAETLLVVAIVMVLAGVAFIAVQNYQRSMYQLEFDGIAREIYFAAQNHLTQADTQGLVATISDSESGKKVDNYKNPDDAESVAAKNDVYYYAAGGADSRDGVLALMLPNFAVDTNSTLGSGTFFILYQKSTATVLDVFYTSASNSRFGLGRSFTGDTDYGTLIALRGDSQKSQRRSGNDLGAIIGYYGGENAQEERITLKAPELKVENAEKLIIHINNYNVNDSSVSTDDVSLQLIVTGKTSDAKKTISILKNGALDLSATAFDTKQTQDSDNKLESFDITLDDVTTAKLHFADNFADNLVSTDTTQKFIPGEDITVQAKVFSVSKLANIAWSGVATTNSLFADPYPYVEDKTVLGSDVGHHVAAVANFRHLENLDEDISSLYANNDKITDEEKRLSITIAAQIANMDWDNTENLSAFVQKIGSDFNVKKKDNTDATAPKLFYPVSPDYILAYNGQNHFISNVKVNFNGNAGLFGTLAAGSEVKNLLLLDYDITASSGNAGGLIGELKSGKIDNCAATGFVKNTGENGNTGGLIGAVTGTEATTVSHSYTGGHTEDGSYAKWLGIETESTEDDHPYDVDGKGTVGGLIGDAGRAEISYCYSTCSVQGSTVGGFIGNGTGKITKCYCTGLVKGTTEGAAEGAFSGAESITAEDCYFFEIINERRSKDNKSFEYLTPLVKTELNTGTDNGISAIDESALTYETFCGSDWKNAVPHDGTLKTYYGTGEGDNRKALYNLKTVQQLDDGNTTLTDTDVTATHYGDWPAPEIFVVNTASSGTP